MKEKLDLEKTLSDMEEALGNRSTESEAQGRVAELFDMREEVGQLKAAASEKARNEAKSKHDLQQAQSRIAQLETKLSTLVPIPGSASSSSDSSRQVSLLLDKVERLRRERDDLRLNLHYIQHEHHFAYDAAEADKVTALADLVDTRSKLAETVDTIENLKDEHGEARTKLDEMTTRLDSVSGSYATASAEKDDLADKLSHLELDLKSATTSKEDLIFRVAELDQRLSERLDNSQVQDLISQLALARNDASRAEREMIFLRKANREFEERVDQLQANLEAREEVENVERPAGGANRPPSRNERPPNRSSIGPGQGHIRRLSGVYSTESVESLKAERADLRQRIQLKESKCQGLRRRRQRDNVADGPIQCASKV